MEKRTYKVFTAVLLASLLIWLVGCTENKEPEFQDENIKTIEAVLQKNLTIPDEELEQLFEKGNREESDLEAFRKYEEDLYREYFADDQSYIEYVSSYGSVLAIDPVRNGYKIKVNNIEF